MRFIPKLPCLLPGRRAAFALLAFLLFYTASPAHAQRDASDLPRVTRAIALENARIVQEPGRVIEKGTILMRNGRIEAVGENVSIPYDAELISLDSMTVYAAFIDGLSTAGVPEPESEGQLPAVPDPGNPPDDRAGIQPQRDVRVMLSAQEDAIEDLRAAGFGAAHVVPTGRMLPGSGAVILLGGDEAGDMVLRGDASMFVQFQGARGVYPGTPMGIMATFRQLYTEAGRRQMMQEHFDDNPAGGPRPEFDAVHYAFFPVLDGEKPAFVFAEDALEIHRALRLRDALGFSLVLAGLHEGFDAVDALAASRSPLFVTTDLPDKPRWMARIKRDSIDTILAAQTPEARTATFRDIEAERRNLEARQLRSRDEYASVAAKLHEAGVSFGFTTRGTDADDIQANIREMIDRGLPEDAALAALTTDAAANLGVSAVLGTVDAGKIANLVVASGPLFAEETHYPFVFVDGRKYAYEEEEEDGESQDGERRDSLSGTWTFTAYTPDGEQSGETTFERSDDVWHGTITYEDGSATFSLVDIKLDGRSLSFAWNDPNSGRLTVEGSISGDEFEGTFVAGGQSMPVTGVRRSGPESSGRKRK